MRPRIVALALLAAAPVVGGCEALVGHYVADLGADDHRGSETIDSSPLCDLERDVFVVDLDLESHEALPNLESYYAAANPELIDHFSALARDYEGGQAHAGVTYLTGAAGVGKSFAVRNVLTGFAEEDECSAALGDLFGEDAGQLGFEIAPLPDLTTVDGQLVFNELPAIAGLPEFDLDQLLTAAGCIRDSTLVPLVVIDDLDELQDASATAILEAIDNFVLDGAPGAGTFVHFIVVGRSSAFGTWLTDPERTERNNEILQRFDLRAPTYRTAGDLDFRVQGYLDFTGQLEDTVASGELDAYVASVTDAVSTHPFLSYSTGNLALGNAVVEHTAPGRDESEAELKAGLFDDLLLRNAQSHGRPGGGSEYDEAYREVLERIAVRYVDVDDEGRFTVRSEDTVDVTDANGEVVGEVRVRDVLNRGGVAFLISPVSATTRYRFEPFWLHAHLIERHNQRLDPDWAYHTCE